MQVVVLGSGVIGTTTAYFLARQGHEVTVIDRQPGSGLETSFANGGQVSPSHCEPWANPETLKLLPRWLFREDAPVIIRWRADPKLWAFGLRFLANCRAAPTRRNTERAWRIGRYSLETLQQIRQDEGGRDDAFSYDEQTRGILHIYQDNAGFNRAADHARHLARDLDCPQTILGAGGCVAHEPALAAIRDSLAGGVLSPADESGDAHLFTTRLAARTREMGVLYRYGTGVLALDTNGDRVTAVRLSDGTSLKADAVVAALGSYTPLLLRQIGIRLPVYPLKGYSVTVPVDGRNTALRGSITDNARRIVFSRLGNRLRAAGTAELAGYDLSMNPVRSRAILTAVETLFPDIGDTSRAEFWCGLRPASPDGVPVLGPTRFRNLYLNTGHGTLGWTMAAGSARVVADLVSGRQPDIDIDGLTIDRF